MVGGIALPKAVRPQIDALAQILGKGNASITKQSSSSELRVVALWQEKLAIAMHLQPPVFCKRLADRNGTKPAEISHGARYKDAIRPLYPIDSGHDLKQQGQ